MARATTDSGGGIMALLTASEDELRYDPLRDNDGKGYDPLSKEAGRRVKIYDNDLGYAAHPEGKAAAINYRDNVNEAATEQQGALNQYKKDFATNMSEADAQAQGLLGGIKNIPDQETIAVRIIGNGQVESTHYINRGLAEELLPQINSKTEGFYTPTEDGDGNWRIDANGYGKELRDMISNMENQTNIYGQQLSGMNDTINQTRQGAQATITSQRGIAQAKFDQEVTQADTVIEQTKGLWTTFLTEQQEAFTQGMQTNTGGIKDLLDSGALVAAGTVK